MNGDGHGGGNREGEYSDNSADMVKLFASEQAGIECERTGSLLARYSILSPYKCRPSSSTVPIFSASTFTTRHMGGPTDAIDFEPKGLLTGKKDNIYILNHADIIKLLKYVWGGVLLPTDKETYVDRMHLSDESAETLGPLIDKLIPSFTSIHENCKKFKDDTYPSIVSLASDVRNYALKAGGDGVAENSHYAYLKKFIDVAAKDPDPQEAADAKKVVKELIDGMIGQIKDLVDKAIQKNQDLRAFEEQCKVDQQNLDSDADAVKAELKSRTGDLSALEKQIEKDRAELKEQQEEYEHDCILAETTPTYAWCTIFGLIAAISVASVYGVKATAAKKRIDELTAAIESENKQITADNRLIGDINSFQSNLDSLRMAALNTIETIERMIGVWGSIGDDLEILRGMTDKEIRVARGIVLKIEIQTISAKWKTLQDSVERYQAVACISAPEEITLEEAAEELLKYIPPKD